MSPALPREERDAIRAALGRGWVRCDVCIGVSPSWDGHEPGCSEWARERLTALLDALDALDAAEEENERHALANGGCVPADAYRDLAEHVAALRGRIEAFADRTESAGRVYGYAVAHDLRALAADEGERTGR